MASKRPWCAGPRSHKRGRPRNHLLPSSTRGRRISQTRHGTTYGTYYCASNTEFRKFKNVLYNVIMFILVFLLVVILLFLLILIILLLCN